jgi:protein-S-isoprenylcysteine O-methyltransferase Ste14
LEVKEKTGKFLQRARVPLGLLLSIVVLILARPTYASLIVGSAIALVGLMIRAWASGHIRKSDRLAVTGPYSFTRNPLYLGSFFLAGGFAIAAGIWWLAIIIAIVYLGIYFPVIRVEEGELRSRFGVEFEEFAANVPRFFPRLRPWKKLDAAFDFQLYLKHKEYEAAAGAFVAIGILAAKMYWFPQ